jgi:hypothetical protein
MSHIDQLSAAVPAQSISEVLSPGIVSIFVQGLETGIILSQFFQWLYHQRTEGIAITVLVVFVTTVGLSDFPPSPQNLFFPSDYNLLLWGPIAWRLPSVLRPHGGSMFAILAKR